jgi:hypothetical protein
LLTYDNNSLFLLVCSTGQRARAFEHARAFPETSVLTVATKNFIHHQN